MSSHKKVLILEGGAMRGMFTCGVIDVFMENGINFDGAAGISAGATFGCNYKSRQIGRAIRYNKKYSRDWRYCSLRSLIKTGDLYGAEFCYHTMPEQLDPFDTETFRNDPMEFYIGATDVETGEVRFHKCTDGGDTDIEWMRASASMPVVSNIVSVDGYRMLDGGIVCSVPYEYMEQQGFLEYLKYSIGEYDFLVNKFGRQGTAAIATDSDTLLTENAVSSKTWQNRQVYYHEVGKHLDGGAWLRVLRALDRWSMMLNYLLIIGTGIFAGFTHRWILLGAAVAALILTIVLRSLIGKKALQEFQVSIPAWKVVPLELNMQWHRFLTRMRYEYADKNDFISHKV